MFSLNWQINLMIQYLFYNRQVKVMQNFDQTNYFQSHQQTKVKTPAALFSKSSSKSPINRLSIQQSLSPVHQQSSNSMPNCENHNNKNAAYFTQAEDERLYFCEKCAINLASKGHNINKMQRTASLASMTPRMSQTFRRNTEEPKNVRQGQISGFLSDLRSLRGTIDSTREAIKERLIQSEQFYGIQIEQVNDYFSLIIKSLQLEKHKCYNHILNERKSAEQQIRNMNDDLGAIDQDITKIHMDIEDNLDTVYSIEDEMYKLVLSQYLGQQRQFQRCLNGLLLEPIELRKIEFQGVPESIYNISDAVIQNSINNQENMQYRLVDSLNSDYFNNIKAMSPQKENKLDSYGQSQYRQNSLQYSFQGERLKGENHSSTYHKISYSHNN